MAGHVNSMHDQAAQQLRDLIFGGDLTPGAFVDETRLCEQLAISRTPLREALKVLTAEGLIRHEPRRGCFVNQVTEQDLDEIFPVIALLEGRCAFEATQQASDADIATLEELHQQLEDSAAQGLIPQYYAANYAIHEAIIAMARKLHYTVIAEGVETAEQGAFLRLNGCAILQGYYFSKPLPAANLASWLLKHQQRCQASLA